LRIKLFWAVGILILVLVMAVSVPAKSPLFSLIYDMFNQVSIKPQEEGSMTRFAIGTVSIDGREIEDPNDRFTRIVKDIISETATINPVSATEKSLADGKFKFTTYCAVCHGTTREINEVGFAKTKINDLGMIAPAVIALTPFFSDGYVYHKAKYGGSIMPAMGYAVSDSERWNIVNYIRELEKQE
jgi:mono/diheme cytochrome c family protein